MRFLFHLYLFIYIETKFSSKPDDFFCSFSISSNQNSPSPFPFFSHQSILHLKSLKKAIMQKGFGFRSQRPNPQRDMGRGKFRNPCLTMHQPWASLLVYGIKRIEGRSWPAPRRGRLWIHAAGKVPDPSTIKAMEDFYREIYAVNGITDIKFPEHYPVSRLLGCVEVVGCVKCEELMCWEEVPEGVRLEGQTDFCWLCEQPQKLSVPFEMRGNQGVYNLEMKIYEAAVRDLTPVQCPLPVKFPLPDPRDPFSLKPGSLITPSAGSKASKVEKPPSLTAAIACARAAATQFSKKDQKYETESVKKRVTLNSAVKSPSTNKFSWDNRRPDVALDGRLHRGDSAKNYKEQSTRMNFEGNSNIRNKAPCKDLSQHLEVPSSKVRNLDQRSGVPSKGSNFISSNTNINCEGDSNIRYQAPSRDLNQHLGVPSKIFAVALRGLRPA